MEIRCPSCDSTYSSEFDLCPTCGAASPWRSPLSRAEPEETSGTCQFCKKSRPTSQRFLCVSRRRYFGASRVREWINLGCQSCLACAIKGSWLGFWLPLVTVVGCWFVVPGVTLAGIIVGADIGVFGEGVDRKSIGENMFWILLGVLVFGVLLSIIVGAMRGQWIQSYLGERLDKRIREFVGISFWGIYGAFYMRSEIPEGETATRMESWSGD